MRRIAVAAVLVVSSIFPALAEPPTVKTGDNLKAVLEGYQGKRVTLRLVGNDELTGKLRLVTAEVAHLGELSGREYFDAVVDLGKVSAVIVRSRDQ